MTVPQNIKQKISDSILGAIRTATDQAFTLSQSVVPVDTGALKKSGSQSALNDGAVLKYDIDYASFVERGLKARIDHVKGYYRQGSYVKGYTRSEPDIKPVFFIKNSMTSTFSKLGDILDGQLRTKFHNVKRM